MRVNNCEVEEYRTAQLQSLPSMDSVPVIVSNAKEIVECPEDCLGMTVTVDSGVFPKSTLECPTYGTKIQLGRYATLLRQSTDQ